ncbi:glutaredoxin 2 [Salinisphaera sp. S4-8]|uniref:DUF547 domain-containing protein n=1 Tax=Salinisphaera sp. S4-8 TaxID=633357 RepID=UPI0033424C83
MRRSVVALIVLCLWSTAVLAAPAAKLWPRWQAHDENSTATIDHRAFDDFLRTYVVAHEHAPNGVRYGQVSDADHQRLERYLQAMQQIDIDGYNRDVQRAYWINLYNALTLDLVLDAYPVDSIRDIGGSVLSSGPWKKKRLRIDGEKVSLNDIEHRILRPIWHDGLTHYGVNCASLSCPDLATRAYTGKNVYTLLRENARDYVNSPAGVRFTDDDELIVSKIFDWYGSDFGDSDRAIISYLRRFAGPQRSLRLDMRQTIDGYAYDWALNDEAAIEADE